MSPAAYIATATAAIAVVFAAMGFGTFPCGLLLIEAFAAQVGRLLRLAGPTSGSSASAATKASSVQ